MMLRIREIESSQTIGDLRQKIAELEIQVIPPLHTALSSVYCLESRIDHTWSNYR